MKLWTICKSITLILLTSTLSIAQSVSESFNYPVGTVLDTLVGEAGDGWGGGWDIFEGTPGTIEVTNEDLIWDFTDFEIPHSGNHVIGVNSGGAWSWQRTGRYLSDYWPDEAGKIYWLSFVMEMQNFADQSWAGVGVYDSLTEGPLFGKGWGNLVYSIGSAPDNSETLTSYNNDVGPVWLLIKMVMSGDTLDERVFMWVNPDPALGEPDTADADARASYNLNNGFNRIVYHFGGQFAEQQLLVDEIRLGDSWEDVTSPATDVEPDKSLPVEFSLSQNYPNPFNPGTTITFSLPEESLVTIKVFDVLGNEVETIVQNERKLPGSYIIPFDGTNLTSGVYFYKLQADPGSGRAFAKTNKMLLLK